jgi:hypothetical protein
MTPSVSERHHPSRAFGHGTGTTKKKKRKMSSSPPHKSLPRFPEEATTKAEHSVTVYTVKKKEKDFFLVYCGKEATGDPAAILGTRIRIKINHIHMYKHTHTHNNNN